LIGGVRGEEKKRKKNHPKSRPAKVYEGDRKNENRKGDLGEEDRWEKGVAKNHSFEEKEKGRGEHRNAGKTEKAKPRKKRS